MTQRDNRQPDRDVWFVYRRSPGEYSATPVNPKGWFALLGCILATVAISLGSSFLVARLSPWLMGVTIPIVTVSGIYLTLRLTKARGREIH